MRQDAWTNGPNTEVAAWVAGERRTIAITREAIEAYLGLTPDGAAHMTAGERRLFVMDHVGHVIAAASRMAATADGVGDRITIAAGHL